MGAVHTARFKKFAYNTDGEQNLASWQQYVKFLKKHMGRIQWLRLSIIPKEKDFAESFGGILAMHEIPSRLSKTNNARRRKGLKPRRCVYYPSRTINTDDYE